MPRVETMAATPCFVTERKWCGCAAERIASIAIWTLPAVPFLKPDRHREARGELAVHLALARARADRAPGDEIGDELRRDRVEELAPGGQPELGEVEQEAARQAQALVDLEALVEVRGR